MNFLFLAKSLVCYNFNKAACEAKFDIILTENFSKQLRLMIVSRQIYGIPNFQPITLRSRMKLCA